MPEVKRELRAFCVDMVCDQCGDGLMIHSDDLVMPTYPPQYKHTCNKCGYTTTYSSIYPRVYYE